jgi:beta-glucanase (GH16 family)
VGKEPNMVFTSLHTQDSHGNTINTKKTKIESIEEGFHLYTIEWTPDKIEFFVDTKLVYSFQPELKTQAVWPYSQPFYFIINMAIGGNFGGPEVDDAIFPQKFYIDYIKVYQ